MADVFVASQGHQGPETRLAHRHLQTLWPLLTKLVLIAAPQSALRSVQKSSSQKAMRINIPASRVDGKAHTSTVRAKPQIDVCLCFITSFSHSLFTSCQACSRRIRPVCNTVPALTALRSHCCRETSLACSLTACNSLQALADLGHETP